MRPPRVRGGLIILVAWMAHARADVPLRTGALTAPSLGASSARLGGDAPLLTMYLRTDGSDGSARKEALATCLDALARVPGAGVDVYLDPADRGSPALAEALSALEREGPRRTLLAALATRDLPYWADPSGYPRLASALGLAPVRPRSTGARGFSFPVRRANVADGAARAFLHRPSFLAVPGRSACASEGRELDAAAVEALAFGEAHFASAPPEAADPARAARPVHAVAALGGALASATFTLRVDLHDRAGIARQLADVDEALKSGRVRVVIEPMPADDLPLLRRALAICDPTARRRLLEVVLRSPVPCEPASEIWLLQAAGIDPAGLLPPTAPRAVDGPTAPPPPRKGPERETSSARRVRLPSLTNRIENQARLDNPPPR